MAGRVHDAIRLAFHPTDRYPSFDAMLDATTQLEEVVTRPRGATAPKSEPGRAEARELLLLELADELRTVPDRVSGLEPDDAAALGVELRAIARAKYDEKVAALAAPTAQEVAPPPSTASLLIEEVRAVMPHLLLAFIPTAKLRFRSARLQDLLAVAPPDDTTASYRDFFRRFSDVAELINPPVLAEGFARLSTAQVIGAMGRVMTSAYDWSEASIIWEDTVLACTSLADAADAVMSGVHETYDGRRVPEWSFCTTTGDGQAASTGGSRRQRQRRRGGGGRPAGDGDAADDTGQDTIPADTNTSSGDTTGQGRDKPTLYDCPVHGRVTHKPQDCRVLLAKAEAEKAAQAAGPSNTTTVSSKPAAQTPAAPASGSGTGVRRSRRIAAQRGGELGNVGGAPLTTPITINGQTFAGIIDTGASRTCVSEGIATRLKLETVEDPRPPGGPDQAQVGIGRMASVDVELPTISEHHLVVGDVNVYILGGGDDKVLVGADLLRRVGLMTNHSLFLSLPPVQDDDPAAGLPHHQYLDGHVGNVAEQPHIDVPDDFPLKQELSALAGEYADVFADIDGEGADIDPCTIRLREGAPLPHARPRPLRPDTLERVHEKIDAMRDRGTVRDATGDVASPAVVAGKKGTDEAGRANIRLCADYRELNESTVADLYPIPDIRSYIQDLPPWRLYFTADLSESYHQMPMAAKDVHLTALTVPGRFVEYLFAPFGLKNLPGQFQRAIGAALAPLKADGTKNYFDDIVGGADDAATLVKRWRAVLRVCRERRLRLKPAKCHVGHTEIEVLGFLVSQAGRRPLPARVAAIKAIAPPRNVRDLRAFIGQVCYVADFIPRCQLTLKPLHLLTADGAEWTWCRWLYPTPYYL